MQMHSIDAVRTARGRPWSGAHRMSVDSLGVAIGCEGRLRLDHVAVCGAEIQAENGEPQRVPLIHPR
jgi:hypothetical protein